jgi:branched-chain amino acid transport system permease protein
LEGKDRKESNLKEEVMAETHQLQIEESFGGRVLGWAGSAAGITVAVTLAAAIVTAIDKGPYVIVNTLVTGGMWGLMALGLALCFGVMNLSNFAHGEYFMLGTLAAFYIITPLHNILYETQNTLLMVMAPVIAIFSAFFIGGIAGAVTDKTVFAPLRKRSKEQWMMNCFLVTIGLGQVLINAHQLIFGTVFKGIVAYWDVPSLSLFGVYVSVDRVFTFLLALLVIILFWFFMKFSRTGRAVRAVSQDEAGALMVGISVPRIHTFTLALSCALAGLAGASLLFMFPSYPGVGLVPLYNSWFVIIIVGFGNVAGAIAGGFIIAFVQVATRVYMGEGWESVIPMLMISLVLIFRPTGIFGAKVRGIWER